jgi:hypothetical protein
MRVARAEGQLVNCDDAREERRILDRLNIARLIEQTVAAPLRKRGAENIVGAGVPPQIERAV